MISVIRSYNHIINSGKNQRDELATKKFYNRFNNIPSLEVFTRQVSDEEMENWLNQEEI